MNLKVLALAAVAIAAPIKQIRREEIENDSNLEARAINWAGLFGLDSQNTATPPTQPSTTAATQLATTAASIPTTSSSKGGFWADLFGGGPTSSTPPAPQTTSSVPATTTSATSQGSTESNSLNGSSGFLDSLKSLFGGDSESSSSATSGSGSPKTTQSAQSGSSGSSGTSGSGWLSDLLNAFKGSGSSLSTSGSPTPAPTSENTGINGASSYTQAESSSTDGSGGLGGIIGSSPSSSSLDEPSAASRDQPSFTEPVTVGGTGDDSSSTGSQSSGSASTGLSLEIAKVGYAAQKGGGITYSPYTKGGQCKTADEVASDMKMLRSYGLIRLYNVDCSGIQNVMKNLGPNQKAYLGVWSIDNLNNDLGSLKEQVESSSRGWSGVHTIAIGNELVNAGTKTPSQIQDAVNEARSWLKSNASSFSGYVVSVDTLAAVMKDKLMCDISDYLAVNCHPYFSGVEASTSGSWLKQQVNQLKQHCGNGKEVLVTESGWPTSGNTVGKSVPSISNQMLAVKSLGDVMGELVIMFTTYNDYWKNPGPYNVEQHWGIYGNPEF